MPVHNGPTQLSSTYRKRWPVLVEVNATGTGPHEISVTIPDDWDYFWDNVQDTTNGYDIVLTEPDGETIPTYGFVGFDHTNRVLAIRASGVAFSSASSIDLAVMWLYWDKDSATNLTGSPTSSSPKTGRISLTGPTTYETVVNFNANALETVKKDPLEDIFVWFNLDAQLARRIHTYESQNTGEGPEYVDLDVTDDGASQSMTSLSTAKAVLNGRGELLLGMEVYDGTNGDTYLVELQMTTTEGRQRLFAARLEVDTRAE